MLKKIKKPYFDAWLRRKKRKILRSRNNKKRKYEFTG